jgi:uncharacterized protein YjbJ (UPF0337 family)
MNWDQVKGNWKQFKGKVKAKWGQLTDDDLTTIEGKRDQLAGKLQERYGYTKDQAERELDQNVERGFAKRGKSNMFMERYCSGNSWLFAWFSQGWFCHF